MKAYVCRAMVLQEDQRDGLTGAGGQRFGRWDLAERSKNLQWVRRVSRTSATALHRDTHTHLSLSNKCRRVTPRSAITERARSACSLGREHQTHL